MYQFLLKLKLYSEETKVKLKQVDKRKSLPISNCKGKKQDDLKAERKPYMHAIGKLWKPKKGETPKSRQIFQGKIRFRRSWAHSTLLDINQARRQQSK